MMPRRRAIMAQILTNMDTASRFRSLDYVEEMPTKPQLVYALIAQSAILAAGTNNWSYINVFTDIVLMAGQPNYFSFAVAARISGVPIKPDVVATIKLFKEGEEEAFQTLDLPGVIVTSDINVVGQFNAVKITQQGKYLIKILINGIPLDDGDKYFFTVKSL
jgi:hypothetical protein